MPRADEAGEPQDVAAGEFNLAAWKEELRTLNPWARDLGIDENNVEFTKARHDAMLRRHAEGVEVWNAWAKSMLALKAALETADWWEPRYWLAFASERVGQVTQDQSFEDFGIDAAKVWLALAASAFSTEARAHRFESDVSFGGYIFPSVAWFGGATFSGSAKFGGAIFSGDAGFESAAFSGYAGFPSAIFNGAAIFESAIFHGEAPFVQASFAGATFNGDSLFGSVTFGGDAFFGATFNGDAFFGYATFKGYAFFGHATFNGSAAFSHAKFKQQAAFDHSKFQEAANFEGIDNAAALSLADAIFKRVPNFFSATFKGKLRLDNVETPRYPWLGYTPDKDATARFRELRRHAAEAQDHERELEFFAQELRSGRFHVKGLPPWVPKLWSWRFWFGLGFEVLSNFGRSLWRPLFFWLILGTLCAVFYLGENSDMRRARETFASAGLFSTLRAYAVTTINVPTPPPACAVPDFASTNAAAEAIQLSLKNAVVFNVGGTESLRRALGCLYGLEGSELRVPFWVSIISTIQTVLSGLFIFLFLLAIRNLLRLR